MAIFLRQSHLVKPPRWGSPADVQYAIRVNSEKIYGCNPDNDVLVMPGFWGLPPLDYSGYNNHGEDNYGATFKDGSISFDGTNRITGSGVGIGTIGTGNYTISVRIYKKDSEAAGVVAFDTYVPVWAIDTNEHLYVYHSDFKTISSGTINLNSWQMITFVRSGTGAGELSYFIEGKSAGTATHSNSISAVTTFVIGTDRVAGSISDFTGFIGEVRISNVARTVDQIALFHDRPWDLYRPIARVIYSIPIFIATLRRNAGMLLGVY